MHALADWIAKLVRIPYNVKLDSLIKIKESIIVDFLVYILTHQTDKERSTKRSTFGACNGPIGVLFFVWEAGGGGGVFKTWRTPLATALQISNTPRLPFM